MSAYSIISSASHALTSTPYTFPADPVLTRLVRVYGDANFHVRTDGGDATADDMPVTAGLHGVLLNVPPGGSLSVIKQAGASDGTVWFTNVKRT